MSTTDSKTLYQFVLQQMAAESYFEGISLTTTEDVKKRLILGANREGYKSDNSDLNEGYPGYTRMTSVMADEFLKNNRIVHQWSDNPTTGAVPGSRPAAEGIDGKPKLNTDILANTGFSATLIQTRDSNGVLTGEYTLAMRSTEFRDWAAGGDGERDKSGTDAQSLAQTGFALAQLDAMEKYYQWLKDNHMLDGMTQLNVTGYSLGGHLATVFTEMHQGEMGSGQTVTFNGAGRGTFSGTAGSVTPTGLKAMIDFFDAVLNDPNLDTPPASDDALGAMWQSAVALKGTPFDTKSLYSDTRYLWASKATAFKYGLSTLPFSDDNRTEGLQTDDKITQVWGRESIHNMNFTANSGVHGETLPVGIESQPLLEGLSPSPADLFAKDFGNAHSITLIADSLALQRAMTQLDPSFDLQKFIDLLPDTSNKKPSNGTGATYETDPLENVLDALRRCIQDPKAAHTAFKDGAGVRNGGICAACSRPNHIAGRLPNGIATRAGCELAAAIGRSGRGRPSRNGHRGRQHRQAGSHPAHGTGAAPFFVEEIMGTETCGRKDPATQGLSCVQCVSNNSPYHNYRLILRSFFDTPTDDRCTMLRHEIRRNAPHTEASPR